MKPNRRELLAALGALGIGPIVFQRAAVAVAADPVKEAAKVTTITPEMIKEAEWIAGVTLGEDERKAVARTLTQSLRGQDAARQIELTNDVAPAVRFDPMPGQPPYFGRRGTVAATPAKVNKPEKADELAFLSVTELGNLLRAKQISSVELTKLHLDRLRKYDPVLKCVITLTDDLAMKQAQRADEELANGKDRGPLHGIPWGAKDLIAVAGYKTTWGAGEYKDQTLEATA